MKKSILNLEGAQVLSRNEQKSINGGLAEGSRSCKLVIMSPNGTSVTYTGTCSITVDYNYINGTPYPTTRSYCNVGLGDSVPLTSNGGSSYC